MEDGSGQQKISVQIRVVFGCHDRQLRDGEGVFKEPAKITMVKDLGSRGLPESRYESMICQKRVYEVPEMPVFDPGGQALEL